MKETSKPQETRPWREIQAVLMALGSQEIATITSVHLGHWSSPSANTPGCSSWHPQKKNIFSVSTSRPAIVLVTALWPHHSSKYFSVSTSSTPISHLKVMWPAFLPNYSSEIALFKVTSDLIARTILIPHYTYPVSDSDSVSHFPPWHLNSIHLPDTFLFVLILLHDTSSLLFLPCWFFHYLSGFFSVSMHLLGELIWTSRLSSSIYHLDPNSYLLIPGLSPELEICISNLY